MQARRWACVVLASVAALWAASVWAADQVASLAFGDAVWMAFVGGVLLNIMPCVLPVVIPKIKHLMGLARKSGEGAGKRRLLGMHALAYTGGVLTTMMGLAGVVIGLQGVGKAVGWGFQFQSLPFLLFMVILLFVMGLGMLKVFSLKAPAMENAKGDLRQMRRKAPYLESYLSGLLVTFLGTPCTAPLLGPALGYAFAEPPATVLLFFFLVGLGLSFPFLVLGVWTGWTRLIPDRFYNETYDHVTRGLGFLLLVTAIWLLDVILMTYGENVAFRSLLVLWVLGIAAWGIGVWAPPTASGKRRALVMAGFLVAAAIGAATLWTGFAEERQDAHRASEWIDYQPALLDALRAGKRPVFVDFTAEWCANCKANEKLFINQPETAERFAKYHFLTVKGDYTDGDDAITAFLQRFNRSGVPLYLVIPPCATKDEQVIVLPEFLSRKLLDDALDKAGTTSFCQAKPAE